jgi:predicted nucleotidyltransferase
MGQASDIDVFIECDPDGSVSLLHIIGIKHIIEDDLGRRVDITTKDSLHPLLRAQIVAEAVQVL